MTSFLVVRTLQQLAGPDRDDGKGPLQRVATAASDQYAAEADFDPHGNLEEREADRPQRGTPQHCAFEHSEPKPKPIDPQVREGAE